MRHQAPEDKLDGRSGNLVEARYPSNPLIGTPSYYAEDQPAFLLADRERYLGTLWQPMTVRDYEREGGIGYSKDHNVLTRGEGVNAEMGAVLNGTAHVKWKGEAGYSLDELPQLLSGSRAP
jgi:hypothetical protein